MEEGVDIMCANPVKYSVLSHVGVPSLYEDAVQNRPIDADAAQCEVEGYHTALEVATHVAQHRVYRRLTNDSYIFLATALNAQQEGGTSRRCYEQLRVGCVHGNLRRLLLLVTLVVDMYTSS